MIIVYDYVSHYARYPFSIFWPAFLLIHMHSNSSNCRLQPFLPRILSDFPQPNLFRARDVPSSPRVHDLLSKNCGDLGISPIFTVTTCLKCVEHCRRSSSTIRFWGDQWPSSHPPLAPVPKTSPASVDRKSAGPVASPTPRLTQLQRWKAFAYVVHDSLA